MFWTVKTVEYGRLEIRNLDTGRADPEGIAQWVADVRPDTIVFEADLVPVNDVLAYRWENSEGDVFVLDPKEVEVVLNV